jgi:hypothetical protein
LVAISAAGLTREIDVNDVRDIQIARLIRELGYTSTEVSILDREVMLTGSLKA